MSKKRIAVLSFIILSILVLTFLSARQFLSDKKAIENAGKFAEGAKDGKIRIEENQKKADSDSKLGENEEASVSIFFNTSEDTDIGEDLLGLLEAYMDGEGKIEYPASWEENIKIRPEEGINKVPGVFDNPHVFEERKKEMLSSAESFKNFKPYTLSPNVDMYPIILSEIIKIEYADNPEEMILAAREAFSQYYPRTRLQSIDDIDNLSMDNLQAFEVLIGEEEEGKLEKKLISLSKGVTKYFKEKDPTYMTDEEGLLVKFPQEELYEFSNGRLIPEGKKYIAVQTILVSDERVGEILYKKGFRTE